MQEERIPPSLSFHLFVITTIWFWGWGKKWDFPFVFLQGNMQPEALLSTKTSLAKSNTSYVIPYLWQTPAQDQAFKMSSVGASHSHCAPGGLCGLNILNNCFPIWSKWFVTTLQSPPTPIFLSSSPLPSQSSKNGWVWNHQLSEDNGKPMGVLSQLGDNFCNSCFNLYWKGTSAFFIGFSWALRQN